MENDAWRFRAKRIRNDVAAGKFNSFIEYVKERLKTETSFQFIADGQEHLPLYEGPDNLDPLLAELGDESFISAHFFGSENLTSGRPFNLLVIGIDADHVKAHLQAEMDKMSADGIIPDMTLTDMQTNDN